MGRVRIGLYFGRPVTYKGLPSIGILTYQTQGYGRLRQQSSLRNIDARS